MGRYYNGDIEGKFWFAVQSSDAATRFGVEPTEPAYLQYSFYEENLEDINKELKAIEDRLGDKLAKLNEFFSDGGAGYRGYTDDMIREIGITSKDLSEYADHILGMQIKKCVEEKGECHFDAEL